MKKKLPLHNKIFIGLALGAFFGLLCRRLMPESAALDWIVGNLAKPAGSIFLRLVFMAVVPLIVSALTLGVLEIGDVGKIGRIGIKTLLLTLALSSIAVLIGIGGVNLVKPGAGLSYENRLKLLESLPGQSLVQSAVENAQKAKSLSETIVNFIPRNPLEQAVNAFEGGLIPLMVFALLLGTAMSAAGPARVEPLKRLMEAVMAVMLKLIDFAMMLAPIGVAGLIFSVTATVGMDALKLLMKYFFLVLAALALHFSLTYSAAIAFIARRSPLSFFKDISEVIVTAFATSSSNATLPVALKVSQDRLGLPREIGNFVLTIGATANQNGTALYEGITVLFLAQFFGVDLTLSQQTTVVVMSVMAGVGTAGVPGGSLPLIVAVLQSVGIPAEGIGIILGVDRILDMCRTVVNVSGDLAIAACVAAWENRKT
ncbi:MAG: dicarboxylate/amino acid:cation symporter [Elusimicrobia bacterium]|nr:dicarboxylate/amino acid:cation symporter [Elusimicrobiota bacterium]